MMAHSWAAGSCSTFASFLTFFVSDYNTPHSQSRVLTNLDRIFTLFTSFYVSEEACYEEFDQLFPKEKNITDFLRKQKVEYAEPEHKLYTLFKAVVLIIIMILLFFCLT